ncbi:MAG: hypothetical protein ABJJ44_02820 [Paraglaciecola sp.]|uniref:hypothetical protein n=1 Tax=Paraglaciecola sp. TaxID=1920173 RepID=UPI003298A9DE
MKKVEYYACDFPHCVKSALLNTLRIISVLSICGFFILLLQGGTIEEVLYRVSESIREGLVRLFSVLFILTTGLRFYSKYIFLKKNNAEDIEAIELHKKWKNQ